MRVVELARREARAAGVDYEQILLKRLDELTVALMQPGDKRVPKRQYQDVKREIERLKWKANNAPITMRRR